MHVDVPVYLPDHPANVEVVAAVAVRVTDFPLGKLPLHVLGQVMPAGLLVTVPVPVPALCTERMIGAAVILKVAIAVTVALGASLHEDVPVQAPDHPANVEPDVAVAVSVTDVPLAKLALHVLGQLMPAGLLITVPAPVPAL